MDRCCWSGVSPTPVQPRRTAPRVICAATRSASEPFFRPQEWWGEQEIELLTRTSATRLDAAARIAKLSNKDEIEFGQVLIATGANVRRFNVRGLPPGGDPLSAHARQRRRDPRGRGDAERVVLIGGSYIGCEVAASLTMLGKHCTIVMQERVTLERGFGDRTGRFIQGPLESLGVTVHGEDELERFEGEERVAKVITSGGLELAAEAVVIGAGVAPDMQLARARAWGSARVGECAAPRGCETPRRGCSPRATYASTTHRCTAGRCGSSTGTSRSTTARQQR